MTLVIMSAPTVLAERSEDAKRFWGQGEGIHRLDNTSSYI